MAFNLDWITDEVAVGGSFPVELVADLVREHRVQHVVDVRSECCDDEVVLAEHGVAFLHLPTCDCEAIDEPLIERGVSWVCERIERRERVYIHCEHGIGRSALLAWCVLVHRGEAPIDALRRLKDARNRVSPTPQQIDAFVRFAAVRKVRHGFSWDVPNFDEIARIAYRHLRR